PPTPGASAALESHATAYSHTSAFPYTTLFRSITAGTHNSETVFVDKGTLTLSTTVHQAPHVVVAQNGHVSLGTVLHDNASLSGAAAGCPPTAATTCSFSGGCLRSATSTPHTAS